MTVILTTPEVLALAEGVEATTICTRRGEPLPTTGYYVAIARLTGLGIDVATYYNKRKAELAWTGRYLGIWTDGDTTYLDVVECISERAAAEQRGREQGEIAIWDIANAREIRL